MSEVAGRKRWKSIYDVFFLTGLVVLLITLEQTLRWSNHWMGFLNGAFHGSLVAIPTLLVSTLWVLFIWRIFDSLKSPRLRPFIVYLPIIWLTSSIFSHYLSSNQRFRSLTGIDLSPDTTMISEFHSGGGFADPSHFYYLKMSPVATEALIEHLDLIDHGSVDEVEARGVEIDSFENPRHYRNHNTGKNRYFDLYTDEAHQLVYLVIFSI